MSGGPTVGAAALEEFQRTRPDAEYTSDAGRWTGSVIVCRKRLEITYPTPELLFEGLSRLAALDAEAEAIGEAFPNWRLWLSSADRWWATRRGAPAVWRGVPLTLDADDLPTLRVQLENAKIAIEAMSACGARS